MQSNSGTQFVKNKLINALLEAIFDVLDKDGLNSILNYAKLQYMAERLPSKGEVPYEEFLKLVDAMNFLLAFSKKVIFEIGRKFSFYLSPFGTQMMEFIDIIHESLIEQMNIEIKYPSDNIIEIKLNSCPFCTNKSVSFGSSTKQGIECEFFKGVFWETVKKSSNKQNAHIEIEHASHKSDSCLFVVKIIIIS